MILLIRKHGIKSWKSVSTEITKNLQISRTPKQCRDRWFNNLKNDKNTEPFTEQEIMSLFQLFDKFGPQWAKISQQIPTRTENQLKNFMNATVRRNIRKFNKGKLEHERINQSSLDVLHIPEVRGILLMDKNVNKEWFLDKFLSAEALAALEYLAACKNPGDFVLNLSTFVIPMVPDYFSLQVFNFVEQYNPYQFY